MPRIVKVYGRTTDADFMTRYIVFVSHDGSAVAWSTVYKTITQADEAVGQIRDWTTGLLVSSKDGEAYLNALPDGLTGITLWASSIMEDSLPEGVSI